MLPDDVLLGIFENMYPPYSKRRIKAWQTLVRVCRRWRSLVLGSPRRLNLRLCCTPGKPTKDTLDLWPAFPLVVDGIMTSSSDTVNVIEALGQSNRVCQVFLLRLVGWQLEEVLAVMQVPFPELTDLQLSSYDETPPIIPDSFLGGSAPRLRYFKLSSIPFPGFPKLLLSATHLVRLRLSNIPHSGYISPEAMVAFLPGLSNLTIFYLEFQSPQSRPGWDRRSLPPPIRSILPSLDQFNFKGVTEYLEDLVTFIDAPQLKTLNITFFNQIDFDYPRLAQFINSTPKLRTLDEAHLHFEDCTASVKLRCRTSQSGLYNLLINISCREPDWQLSSIEQICNSSLHPLSTVVDLNIGYLYSSLVWKDDASGIENTLWLELLRPFIAVKNLYLSREFAPGVAAALQDLVETRMTEVLPNLQNIFVERLELLGSFQENIGQFVTARQLSGHPVVISVL